MRIRHLKLNIDGTDITDLILQHVSVTQALNDHWWCHTECRHMSDQRYAASGGGPPSDDPGPTIKAEEWLGKELKVIEVENDESVLFQGFVFDLELIYELSVVSLSTCKG